MSHEDPFALPYAVKVIANPYPHTIPDAEFHLLIDSIAQRLRDQIYTDYTALEPGHPHKLKRSSLGLCVMDPTLPRSTPAQDAVMALITIGLEGEDLLVNGVGKAVTHWELGQDCGIGAYVHLHRLRDGSFVYGHSAELDGTIVGASGATEQQDRSMATQFAAEFNSCVADARKRWRLANPVHKWYCNQDEPDQRFTKIAGWLQS
ncbi:MAG: hypothetical protein QG658_159 [Patescibacteria group bacterium]|jgi:hypothetical protein|nr:hypothetical protein [Patescibacteria group bacterium]